MPALSMQDFRDALQPLLEQNRDEYRWGTRWKDDDETFTLTVQGARADDKFSVTVTCVA